jgi:hypothetical protein
MRQTCSSPSPNTARPAPVGRDLRRFVGVLLVSLGLLGWLDVQAFAEDAPAAPAPAEDEPAAPKEGETPAATPEPAARKPILPDVQANPKPFEDLVEGARSYFDQDEEPWRGRMALLGGLSEEAKNGRFWLKDLDALRWLIYQGRSFWPQMTDRKWRASQGIEEYKDLGGTLYWIKSEELTIGFSIPRKYPKEKDLAKAYPRIEPYPMLLTMHDKRDYTGEKYPAEALMKRRYPKKEWKELYEDWMVLCPVAAAGNYINKEGMIRAEVFQGPYAEFWKHYHIDFDRVILDGTDQAFEAASSQAIFFSGIVFRHDGKKWDLADDKMKLDVKNFASVPVYVVDNPKLAEQLKAAGHEQVTAGIGGASLYKWMNERRRVEPTKFEWAVQRFDQVLPYWVNVENPDWDIPERSITVEVVDTEEQPNTVKISAIGIQRIALFLNDEILDLDRKVRVLINGHIEFDEKITPESEMMQEIGRDFDVLFDRDPARIRTSMFFGWLKSARIVGLDVRPPDVKKEPEATGPKTDGPPATPEQEEQARKLMTRAKRFVEVGKKDKAIEELDKILALPKNAKTEEAGAMLAELKKE